MNKILICDTRERKNKHILDYFTFLEQLDFIDSNILKDIRGELYER